MLVVSPHGKDVAAGSAVTAEPAPNKTRGRGGGRLRGIPYIPLHTFMFESFYGFCVLNAFRRVPQPIRVQVIVIVMVE